MRLSEEDEEQILHLTRDVERTWSAVEESHRKENGTRDALALIKAEIEDLRASVMQGAYSSVAAEKKLRDMTAMRDEIGRETDEVCRKPSPEPYCISNPYPSPDTPFRRHLPPWPRRCTIWLNRPHRHSPISPVTADAPAVPCSL